MGLGSILGKILGAGGAAIAAPFTGGASLSALPAILSAGGQAAGAMANSAAGNRGSQFAGQLDLAGLLSQRDVALQNLLAGADNDYTSNQIARQQEGDASAQNAWKMLQSAQHTLSPAQMPSISPYQAPQRQATDAEKQGATALTNEVMQRLQGGNPIAPVEKRTPTLTPINVDPSLLQPSGAEKTGGILSAILGAGGGILGALNGGQRTIGATTGTPPSFSAADLAFLRAQNPQLTSRVY